MTVRDPELLLELRDEPELLAVADALSEVLREGGAATRRRRRAWPVGAAVAAVAAAAIAAGTLLLVTGGVKPTLVDRALAAVGDEPVLHAIISQPQPSETTLVELSTGKRVDVPRMVETEIWFDQEHSLEHTITRATGRPTQDELFTPQGVFSESGPVWTCARIAAHPLEATRERVSCNLNGKNGTSPRHIPEPPPTVEPALGGFVDGYRQALASGAAHRVGAGTVRGQRVYWLEFRLPDRYRAPNEPPSDLRERVAVASDTYRPLVFRPIVNGVAGPDYDVLEIATVSRAEADFSKPELVPPGRRPSGWSARVTGEVALAEASQALGTRAAWVGPAIDGLKLAAVQRQEVTTGYGPASGVPPRVTPVIAFVYGEVRRRHPTRGSLVIAESTRPFAVWAPERPSTPTGYLGINAFGSGYMRVGDVYIEVKRSPFGDGVDATVVAAARRLVPVPLSG